MGPGAPTQELVRGIYFPPKHSNTADDDIVVPVSIFRGIFILFAENGNDNLRFN